MILGRLLESRTQRGDWLAKNCCSTHMGRQAFGTADAGRKADGGQPFGGCEFLVFGFEVVVVKSRIRECQEMQG